MESFKHVTLLVVDDEADLRECIAEDFESRGFTVLTAENGTQALEVIQSRPVDLVISDMRMPHGDGMFLLEQIRARHPEIPVVILITGHADHSEKACLEKGARKILTKPFDANRLQELIVEYLQLKGSKKSAA
mgnify:CR=1 FL=1